MASPDTKTRPTIELRDQEGVAARLIEHLRQNSSDMTAEQVMVPAEAYFDPAHAAQEIDGVFRQQPLIVAHAHEIAEPGDFVARTLAGVPVIVVRQDDGAVQVMRNQCRHRGATVTQEEAGNTRTFTCRYHGWNYARNGALRAVPFSEEFGDFDHGCSGLLAYPSEERHGFVWTILNPDKDLDVSAHLGPEIEDDLDRFGMGATRVYHEATFDLDCNWKLVADGFLDAYHTKFLHPQSVNRFFHGNVHTFDDYGRHARLIVARRLIDDVMDIDPADLDLPPYVIVNLFAYPNTVIVLEPEHVEVWTFDPDTDDPRRSRATIRFLIPDEPLDDGQRDRLDKSVKFLLTVVPEEDWVMTSSIQRAIGPGSPPLRLGRNETMTQQLHRQLLADIKTTNTTHSEGGEHQ